VFTGTSAKCPKPEPKDDGSLCNSATQVCRNGVSMQTSLYVVIFVRSLVKINSFLVLLRYAMTMNKGINHRHGNNFSVGKQKLVKNNQDNQFVFFDKYYEKGYIFQQISR